MASTIAEKGYAPDIDKPVMRIGAVADLLGVCVRMVRIYEERGLVQPARKNNQRLYSFNDVCWLGHLRQVMNEECYGLDEMSRLISLPACWMLKDCPEDVRSGCALPESPGKRCWEVAKLQGRCGDCRSCQIYRIATEGNGG